MAAPVEFTLDSVRDFILEKGGRVTNHELVKHFKRFLTDPDRKEAARVQFKDYVNTLATIKQEDGEKYLVLKRKFYPAGEAAAPLSPLSTPTSRQHSPFPMSPSTPDSPSFKAPPPYRPPPEPYRRPSFEANSPVRVPPPPSFEPPRSSPFYDSDSSVSRSRSQSSGSLDHSSAMSTVSGVSVTDSAPQNEPPPPAVPPRKKPASRNAEDQSDKENSEITQAAESKEIAVETSEEMKISVKERTQRFNKMASDIDLQKSSNGGGGRRDFKSKNGDDDDTSSLATMEPRSKEWVLAIARGDYLALTRLLREEPRLARRRDYITYNGLHWAAKHGNADIVKLLAGTYQADVNARTNAGCTALHLAAQQDHEEVFDLLVKAYGADANIRDFSGKKPRQYFPRHESSVSSDTFRKIKAKRNLAAEKETAAGFLRIGSLNVRVKKTTEAFNNLLSSGTSSKNLLMDKLHKPWGSADNLQAATDAQSMPPPKQAPLKKKRPKDWPPQTPLDPACPAVPAPERKDDGSDSDSAYGFGNDWNTP